MFHATQKIIVCFCELVKSEFTFINEITLVYNAAAFRDRLESLDILLKSDAFHIFREEEGQRTIYFSIKHCNQLLRNSVKDRLLSVSLSFFIGERVLFWRSSRGRRGTRRYAGGEKTV